MKKIIIFLVVLTFIATSALTGVACKTTTAATTTAAATTAAATTAAATTAAETTAAATTAAAAAKTPEEEAISTGTMSPGDIKIAHYAPIVHVWWSLLKDGCDMFAKESGITFPTVFGTEWTQDDATQNLQALAADGYKGIGTFAVDATSAPQTYKELQAEGIFIVEMAGEIGSDIPSFGLNQLIKGDAVTQTEECIKLMGEKGNLVHAFELTEDPHTKIRIDAVREVVAKYPNVTLFQELGDCRTNEEATEKIGNLIMPNLDKINGIVATGTAPTIGIANVMTSLGVEKAKKIKSVGIVLGPEAEKAITDGYMDACLDFSTMGMGYTTGVLLSHLIQGWTPKKFLVEITEVMVTQENIAEAKTLMLDAVHQMGANAITNNLNPPK